RVETDVHDLLALVLPHVGAVVTRHHPGRDITPPLGQGRLEHVGRFDDVVVHADEDHVVELHAGSPFKPDVGVRVVSGPVAMALEGIRVLDFTRLGFGSQATLILGCLGAEVLKVESTKHPDGVRVIPPLVPVAGEQGEGFGGASLATASALRSYNRGGTFFKYNTGGKRSITVDARTPSGLRLLEDLVAESDIVTESFAAGTMARWGLGYERLRELKPDIIYVSMCGFGHTGPDADCVTMGPTAQALTGSTAMVGAPGRPPAGWSFSYLDHVGGYLGAFAALHALHHRRQTGEGQHMDVSQLEPGTALVGAALLDFAVNGTRYEARGNRRGGAPQGAYRCQGDDAWVVISCSTDAHWRAFADAIGAPAWTGDERFATLANRVARADELDALVTA